jgi:hypothetical protein
MSRKERRKKLLAGNDNKQKQKPNGEIHFSSRYMFGNGTQRATSTESENNSRELPEQRATSTESENNSQELLELRASYTENENNSQELLELRASYTESENNSQELPEQNEQSSFDNRSNRTDDWFFGSRRKEPTSRAQTPQNQISFDNRLNRTDDWFFGSGRKEPTPSPQPQPIQNQIENYMNNLDLMLLMEIYGTLVNTSKQLKPLIKEITPFFQGLSKKFKSK